MDTTLELGFRRGDQGADDLQAVVDEVLAELAQPSSEAARAAHAAGLEAQRLTNARIEVRETAQGADPFTLIAIGIAVSTGSKVAETLWQEVVWPRVRRRLGVRALVPLDADQE